MNKLVHSVAACLLLCGFAFVASYAQEDPEPGEMRVRGTMDEVRLIDLIDMYSEESGRPVMFQPAQVRQTVTVVAPQDGVNLSMYTILQSALQEYKLVLVPVGAFDKILPAVEAMRVAQTLSLEELEEADPMQFARVLVPVRHTNANTIMGAVRNVMTQHGGMIMPISGSPDGRPNNRGALLLSDYVYNLRDVVDLVKSIDQTIATESGIHTEVVTIRHRDVIEMAKLAVDHQAGRVSLIDDNRLVISGDPASVRRIVKLLTELDVPSED
jgi:type II secretory pathway component GspD/PulD (secretin)